MYLFAPEGADVPQDAPTPPSAGSAFLSNLKESISHISPIRIAQTVSHEQGFDRGDASDLELAPTMSEDDYKNSDWYVPGKYFPGITPLQAETQHEAAQQSQRAAEGFAAHPVAGFTGAAVGSATDPIYYVPFLDGLEGLGVLGKSLGDLGAGTERVLKTGIQFGALSAGQEGYKQARADIAGHPDTDGGSVLPILEGFAGGLIGGAVGEFAHHFKVSFPDRVQAVQKALDQVAAGEPVDVSDVIHIEPVEQLPETTRLYNSGTGSEDVWTSDPQRALSYAPEGAPIKAVDVPADEAEALRTVPGSPAHKAALAANNQPTTTDHYLGDRQDLVNSARPITAEEIEGNRPVKAQPTPSFAPIGPSISPEGEELTTPYEPGKPLPAEAEAALDESGTKFSPTNQRVLEHETDTADHDNHLSEAYLQALACRSAG